MKVYLAHQVMLKKVLLSLAFIVSFSLFNPSAAQAQCTINLPELTTQTAQVCDPDNQTGFMTSLYSPTSSVNQTFADVVSETNSQIFVRIWAGGQHPSRSEIAATIANLGAYNTDKQIVIMTDNEPNNFGNEFGGISNANQIASTIVDDTIYTNSLIQQAGLSGRIVLASPALDLYAGQTSSQMSAATLTQALQSQAALRGYDNFYDLFGIAAINYYATVDQPDFINGTHYTQVLANLGIPSNKQLMFQETGVLVNGRPTYSEPELRQFFEGFASLVLTNNNILGFSTFTRNPDSRLDQGYDLRSDPNGLLSFLQSLVTGRSLTANNMDQDAQDSFDAWVELMLNAGVISRCPDGTFSPDAEYCFSGPSAGNQQAPICSAITSDQPDQNNNNSRPFPCEDCLSYIPNPSYGCSSAFLAKDSISYPEGYGNNVSGCPGFLEEKWGGTFTIDPTQAQIPFIGKSHNTPPTQAEATSIMQGYLAEYLDGTLYYGSYQYSNYAEHHLKSADASERSLISEAGVFKKLAPLDIQNNLKKDVIKRASANQIQDYAIQLDRSTDLAWFLELIPGANLAANILDEIVSLLGGQDARLTDFDQHQPPSITDPDYWTKYRAWKCESANIPILNKVPILKDLCLINTKWATLWKAVPMFSRDDTPGEINIYAQSPNSTVDVTSGDTDIEVPHAQRLYEASNSLQQMIMPKVGPVTPTTAILTPQQPGSIIIAQAQPEANTTQFQVTPQVLATNSCTITITASIENIRTVGDYWVYDLVIRNQSSETIGDIIINREDSTGGHLHERLPPGAEARFSSSNPSSHLYQYPTSVDPSNISASIHIREQGNYKREFGCPEYISAGRGTPQGPTCNQPALGYINQCAQAADPGDGGDTLCCDKKIAATLDVTERVFNPAPPPLDNGEEPEIKIIKKTVERRVGIDVTLPYLDVIWETLSNGRRAVFKSFNPKSLQRYDLITSQDMPGESNNIPYKLTDPSGLESISPTGGTIKYPHLAAIHRTKEYILRLINPKSTILGADESYSPPQALYSDQDTESAKQTAAVKYSIAPEILQAVFEIEGQDYIRNPSAYECTRNSANAMGIAQVVDGTYVTVTLQSERYDDDESITQHVQGKLSRCNIADSFELMARVLLYKVGRFQKSEATGQISTQGIGLNEKDTIYRATYGYYGSYRPDNATRNYTIAYLDPKTLRPSSDGYYKVWQTNITPSWPIDYRGMNYSDIVCNKLGQCHEPENYPHGWLLP